MIFRGQAKSKVLQIIPTAACVAYMLTPLFYIVPPGPSEAVKTVKS